MMPLMRKKLAPFIDAFACPTAPAPMPSISTLQEVDFFGMLPMTDSTIVMQHMLDAERRIAERHALPGCAVLADSVEDVAQAVREQLLNVIDWAKLLQEFKELGSEERQVSSPNITGDCFRLVKNHTTYRYLSRSFTIGIVWTFGIQVCVAGRMYKPPLYIIL